MAELVDLTDDHLSKATSALEDLVFGTYGSLKVLTGWSRTEARRDLTAVYQERIAREALTYTRWPKFYECGGCGSYHIVSFRGDCRDDANRFDMDQLDERFGASGWVEVPDPAGDVDDDDGDQA